MMKEKDIRIFENDDKLSDDFGKLLVEKLSKLPDNNKFNIALSGGSTPKKIFDYISVNYNSNINWDKVNFFWGDERCVPPDSAESNYKMANEHLFKNIDAKGEDIFRIRGESHPDEEAE